MLKVSYITKYGDSRALYDIPLSKIQPSKDQPRLFIEREGLSYLQDIYSKHKISPGSVVLPDPPIVRELQPEVFECLAGHRRITAALDEGVYSLPCRVVHMSDKQAFEFVLQHNLGVEQLTTVEVAYRAAEMERLGYDDEAIREHLGDIALHRYLAVGKLVNPDLFNDRPKKCNPGITTWFEAALHGSEHFDICFQAWNNGLWDEYHCKRYFRKRGKVLPLDNNEKGLRISVTKDGRKLKLRGTLDLDILTVGEVEDVIEAFQNEFNNACQRFRNTNSFGPRYVVNLNPDTLYD